MVVHMAALGLWNLPFYQKVVNWNIGTNSDCWGTCFPQIKEVGEVGGVINEGGWGVDVKMIRRYIYED